MRERYGFIFEYENEWMIVLYENGNEKKYFNKDEDYWDDALDYVDIFLENGGDLYQYKLPSYSCIENLDIFNLKNQPIEGLSEYLHKTEPASNQVISENFMEIERKWLLKKIPEGFPLITEAVCEQAYLSQEPEIRIRKRNEVGREPVYFIDIKSDGNLSRTEVTIPISEMKYETIKNIVGKHEINKNWFTFDLGDNRVLEVTIVDSCSDTEFIYAEVEFDTEKEAEDFVFPIEDAIEVTDNSEYKMKNYWKKTRMGLTEPSWTSNESYEKICKDINSWPEWKKKAYNEEFAISNHAEKVAPDKGE